MPSHVAVKLAHGMQKCTIMTNEQLTSFGLLNVGFYAYTVFIVPRDDTACFSSNSDVTCTVELGLLTFLMERTSGSNVKDCSLLIK